MTPKQVEAAALALPGATLSIQWGADRVYKVGGKMFAAMGGDKAPSLSFKVDDVAFEMLTERDGIIPAPYLARAKWVQLTTLKAMADDELRDRLAVAHRIIVEKLPKKDRPALPKAAAKAAPKKAAETKAVKKAAAKKAPAKKAPAKAKSAKRK